MNTLLEVSLEGMPGPTHHFGGLAYGNLHAMAHAKRESSPKRAALESLAKMSLLLKLGVEVLFMPPQLRPNGAFLSAMGFHGSLMEQLQRAYNDAPTLFLASLSSSFMWTANAATITASCDSQDGKVHITPANLLSQIHRATETATVARFFETYIASENVVVHPPLPAPFADEGAANLIRLEDSDGQGHYLFAYGRSLVETLAQPQKFPARQTREACEAIVRRHGLSPNRVQCVQQHPDAIDAGVFHQDVVAFGHQGTLVAHERAYGPFCSASPNKTGEKVFQGASPLEPHQGTRSLEIPKGALPLEHHQGTRSPEISKGALPLGTPEGASPLGSRGQGAVPQGEPEGAALGSDLPFPGEGLGMGPRMVSGTATHPKHKTPSPQGEPEGAALGSDLPFPGEGLGMGPRMAHLPATHPKNSLPPHITTVEISEKEIPLADLVASYLCNGQIITSGEKKRIFLVPARCQHLPTVTRWLNQNITRFADDLRYIPVEESLKNGGGPACLRLRMPLTAQEYQQVHPGIKLTPAKIEQLAHLVNSLYPDRFHPTDILEAACLDQCLRAVAAISEMM